MDGFHGSKEKIGFHANDGNEDLRVTKEKEGFHVNEGKDSFYVDELDCSERC